MTAFKTNYVKVAEWIKARPGEPIEDIDRLIEEADLTRTDGETLSRNDVMSLLANLAAGSPPLLSGLQWVRMGVYIYQPGEPNLTRSEVTGKGKKSDDSNLMIFEFITNTEKGKLLRDGDGVYHILEMLP